MQGKIIKGIAGFYYVHTSQGLYECKAKGSFRNDGQKPLVGDNVTIEVINKEELLGNIVDILPRSNSLIRPASANIDQALVIFSILKPDPNFYLLDKFLINMWKLSLPTIICFNKMDIATPKEQQELQHAYEKCDCRVLFVSGSRNRGMEELKAVLKGKTTVVAGPSGVGKSTIVNSIASDANMETGEISKKIERGKHTTRHAELFTVDENTYIMDTPGFTSLDVTAMEKEELHFYYPEFEPYEERCKFRGCAHINEPVCGVKDAVQTGEVSTIRYDNYKLIYTDLEKRKRY